MSRPHVWAGRAETPLAVVCALVALGLTLGSCTWVRDGSSAPSQDEWLNATRVILESGQRLNDGSFHFNVPPDSSEPNLYLVGLAAIAGSASTDREAFGAAFKQTVESHLPRVTSSTGGTVWVAYLLLLADEQFSVLSREARTEIADELKNVSGSLAEGDAFDRLYLAEARALLGLEVAPPTGPRICEDDLFLVGAEAALWGGDSRCKEFEVEAARRAMGELESLPAVVRFGQCEAILAIARVISADPTSLELRQQFERVSAEVANRVSQGSSEDTVVCSADVVMARRLLGLSTTVDIQQATYLLEVVEQGATPIDVTADVLTTADVAVALRSSGSSVVLFDQGKPGGLRPIEELAWASLAPSPDGALIMRLVSDVLDSPASGLPASAWIVLGRAAPYIDNPTCGRLLDALSSTLDSRPDQVPMYAAALIITAAERCGLAIGSVAEQLVKRISAALDEQAGLERNPDVLGFWDSLLAACQIVPSRAPSSNEAWAMIAGRVLPQGGVSADEATGSVALVETAAVVEVLERLDDGC